MEKRGRGGGAGAIRFSILNQVLNRLRGCSFDDVMELHFVDSL